MENPYSAVQDSGRNLQFNPGYKYNRIIVWTHNCIYLFYFLEVLLKISWRKKLRKDATFRHHLAFNKWTNSVANFDIILKMTWQRRYLCTSDVMTVEKPFYLSLQSRCTLFSASNKLLLDMILALTHQTFTVCTIQDISPFQKFC